MKNRIKYLLLSFCLFMSFNSQKPKNGSTKINNGEPLIINLEKDFKKATSLRLYKYNSNNYCDQSKSLSIIKDNKISKCFDYVKIIEGQDLAQINKLLYKKNTYGSEDLACFDTEYSLIAFNKQIIIGYINISFSCNKLISNPVINERGLNTNNGLRKIGFSKVGKEKLTKLLNIYIP